MGKTVKTACILLLLAILLLPLLLFSIAEAESAGDKTGEGYAYALSDTLATEQPSNGGQPAVVRLTPTIPSDHTPAPAQTPSPTPTIIVESVTQSLSPSARMWRALLITLLGGAVLVTRGFWLSKKDASIPRWLPISAVDLVLLTMGLLLFGGLKSGENNFFMSLGMTLSLLVLIAAVIIGGGMLLAPLLYKPLSRRFKTARPVLVACCAVLILPLLFGAAVFHSRWITNATVTVNTYVEVTAAPAAEPALTPEPRQWFVVLDAGHGGFDVGAEGVDTGVQEAGLNLKVAQYAQSSLEAAGVRVLYLSCRVAPDRLLMTRTDARALGYTKELDMARRGQLLQTEGADATVSIHMNKYPDRRIQGPMVYYQEGAEEESRTLARSVIDSLTKALSLKSRPANPGDNFVTRMPSCPAVLVECGFLSHPEEELLLQDDAYQKVLGQAIARGVIAWLEGRSDPT